MKPTPCPDCGVDLPETAVACPSCGVPPRHAGARITLVFVLTLAILGIAWLIAR